MRSRLLRRTASALATLLASALMLAAPARAQAPPILDHHIEDGRTLLYLANPNDQPLEVLDLHVEFDGRGGDAAGDGLVIAANEGLVISLDVPLPAVPGSYAIRTWLGFARGDRIDRIVDVDVLDVGTPRRIENACSASRALFSLRGELIVESADPEHLSIVVPDDVVVDTTINAERSDAYSVRAASRSGLHSRIYYGVVERMEDGVHAAGTCRSVLTTGMRSRDVYPRGRIPGAALAALGALFLGLVLSRRGTADRGDADARATVLWSSRMLLLTAGYAFMKDLDLGLAGLASLTDWSLAERVLEEAVVHLRSPLFEPFFRWFADPFYVLCLATGWPYFRREDPGQPLAEDKYAALIGALVPRHGNGWNEAATLGARVTALKLYFVPLMTGWAIGHAIAMPGYVASLKMDVGVLADFGMRLCFFIDTTVFAFGYVVESRRLGNQIRSVDPHLLGWAVCILCYPPFGSFIFDPFAIGERHAIAGPAWVASALTAAIAVLWIIYTSATVALGPKAANLANRGIIARGPYRFVRHPAYAAKLAIWALEVGYFGKAPLFQWLGFALFYVARAWSEERHLGADPDYGAYREKVRWRFIPGIV